MSLAYKEHRTIEVHAYSCELSDELREAFKIFYRMYQGSHPHGIRMKALRPHLSDNQYRNFAKLQYFGLCELQRKIYWHLTKAGAEFYLGMRAIRTPAAWMEGKILQDDHPAWQTYRGKKRMVKIDTPLGRPTKLRPEYEKERRGDTLLSDEQLEAAERGKKKAVDKMLRKSAPTQSPGFSSRPIGAAQTSMFQQNVTEPDTFR